MDYVFLLVLTLGLGAGVAGGLLSAWSCHRRLLALEENLKTILMAYDDRLNQLTKIVVRQDKSEAAKTRWSKKDIDETTLAKTLTSLSGGTGQDVIGHPWDPRTWVQTK
jgi:hypothetical protein